MVDFNGAKEHTDSELIHSLVAANKRTPSNEDIIQMMSPKPVSPDKNKEEDSR